MKVFIARDCTCKKNAEVDISIIDNPKWDNVSGGTHRKQFGHSIYGWIPYDIASDLDLNSGLDEKYGNGTKIVIPARSNNKEPFKEGYKILKDKAGPKPPARLPGQIPCTKRILEILSETKGKGISFRNLKMKLDNEQYRGKEKEEEYKDHCHIVSIALSALRKTNRVITEGPSNSPDKVIKLPKQK